jgi:ABC-2 type transport system ATP-binding protein
MIDVRNLSKAYGAIQALDDVSLQVAAGEIVGLLGPNGAGKTTLIKVLTGYLQPDSGSVFVDGIDVQAQRQAAQARIGYLPENAPLYPDLSVQDYLQTVADLRAIPRSEMRARLSEAIRSTGLTDRLTQPIGTLSKGYRQRVGLAQAILHRPRLLILDEPSVGLDPTQIVEMRNLIRRLAAHSTVLFSSHILSEAEALCNRAVIIINGRVRADARLAELAHSTGVLLVLSQAVAEAQATLAALPGVEGVVQEVVAGDGAVTLQVRGAAPDLSEAIYSAAAAHNWPVRELRAHRQTLESVFNQLALQRE